MKKFIEEYNAYKQVFVFKMQYHNLVLLFQYVKSILFHHVWITTLYYYIGKFYSLQLVVHKQDISFL